MSDLLRLIGDPVVSVSVSVFLVCAAFHGLIQSQRKRQIDTLRRNVISLRERELLARREAEQARESSSRGQETVEVLQRAIVRIPEIAQRLAGTLEVRAIPGAALDLISETTDPDFAVFYRVRGNELVAVETRGHSEYSVGHRVPVGEGVAGWAAARQIAFTEEDARLESVLVRSQNLSKCYPEGGFSICLPIVSNEQTLGVILLGPLRSDQPHLLALGSTIALIAAVSLKSATVMRQQQLLAELDGLTGLLNKTNIIQRATEMIAVARTRNRVASMFMLDIDHFKNFNDTNGHLRGDDLLKSLSKSLGERVRDGESLGRFGGEEFLLLMPGIEKAEALRAADRIRGFIAEQPFPGGEAQPGGRVTISGGVATWPTDGRDVATVLEKADEALYQAKRAGRNQVTAYGPPELALMAESGEERLLADPILGEVPKPEPFE